MIGKTVLIGGLFCMMFLTASFGQKTCTSNPTTIGSDINFGSIVWTASGGATVTECNNMADGLITFTGNVRVDLANNKKITITNDVEINGNFPISGGPGSVLSVSGGSTLHVTGDLGDADNNGVQYEVVTASDEIIVDGTLYGKNNNAFTGNGSISGGTLNVKNGSTCGTPCPVSGGFSSCTSGDSFCTNNSVLPVSLIFFKAETDRNNISLAWATASELNFDYFSIEKSMDGFSFLEIGRVQGQGTTDIRHDYSYVDAFPSVGKLYYRLKTVDFDGYEEYFDIESIDFTGQKSFILYPNPVTRNEISVQLNFATDQRIDVRAFDMEGHEVLNYGVLSGQHEITIPLSLSPGVYTFKLNAGIHQEVKRVVIK